MRILVTGATGFAGGWLVEALLARGGAEVFGLSRRARGRPNGCTWPRGRSCGPATCATAAPWRRPCAKSILSRSIISPDTPTSAGRSTSRTPHGPATSRPRACCTRRRRAGGWPRILFVGSGLVYGPADGPDPSRDETQTLRPDSPYASSKAASDLLSYQTSVHPGLDVVRVRPFNHIGPRQSAQFAVANFARQIAAVERGEGPPVLETGNLGPSRDLTDVRDTVAAYLLLMDRGRTGEAYNVGSGQSATMRAVLDRLVALAGVTVEVRQRAELVRAVDPAAARVDASKLRRETGWTPQFSLDQTLQDTLDYWRSRPS